MAKQKIKLGDLVRVINISEKDKDLTIRDDPEMRTHELFRFCLGRDFKVWGFDEYGHIELHVDEDPAVRRKFGAHHHVWMELHEVKLVAKAKKVRQQKG